MAQQAVHILEDGTIQQCHRFNKRFRSCELRPHWKTVEAAEIYLDNKAYLAERAAKVGEFNEAKRSFSHPRRFNAAFPTDRHSKRTVRSFSEEMDAYVADHGELPLYLHGVMLSNINTGAGTYRTTVRVSTVMDEETFQTDRRWSAELKFMPHHGEDRVLRDVDLDFSSPHASRASHEKLHEVFRCAAELTSPGIQFAKPDTPPASDVAASLMGRFKDMRGAIETVMQRNILEVRNDELGDFVNSDDEKIVVDVEYDRSTFSAKKFRAYFRENLYFNNPRTVDVDLRVTNTKVLNRGGTHWSLFRKDGAWGIVTATDEASCESSITTSEDVRSHVYWHVIREINPDNQEDAFAKSTYAADLFTIVEDELALFNAGAPQPR